MIVFTVERTKIMKTYKDLDVSTIQSYPSRELSENKISLYNKKKESCF